MTRGDPEEPGTTTGAGTGSGPNRTVAAPSTPDPAGPAGGPPLPPEAVAATLQPPGRARGLPAEAYTSDRVFAWEQERFWRRDWVCLGRVDRLAAPGEQAGLDVAGAGVLAVRDATGALRTFRNACRHRGHELVGRGCTVRRSTIWCAYHAWVYRLDGSLRHAPRFDPPPDADLDLLPVRSAQWRGWLFVDLSGDAPPLAEVVGDLDAVLAPYRPETLRVVATQAYDVAANWKLVVENYLECYHCPSTHPELSRVQRTDGGESFRATGAWLGGHLDLRNSAATMSLDGAGPDWTFPDLDEDAVRQVRYHLLPPGLLVTATPDHLVTHRLVPLAADRTRVECEWLFAAELVDAGTDPGYAVSFWHTTNQQDWAACESVQRGVSGGGYRPGPLAPQEDLLHTFLARLAEAYRGAGPTGTDPGPVR
ncbi:aromatic ring-hydroxylating oxygenase subunit alpha [Micromonospora rosaria]|uniref:aromatic ring-hydroxylating oxygenase subunit alpha n=1 Tax=Micromonospora rosaria TaxID=47874 RepID=UPI0037CB9B57